MSNFLSRLIQRQWGQLPTVQPPAQSMFTPAADAASFQPMEDITALRPAADSKRDPLTHRETSVVRQARRKSEQPPSHERPASSPLPRIPPSIAEPEIRPLMQVKSPLKVAAEVEQPPAFRPAEPPMQTQRASDTLVPTRSAAINDATDVQSFDAAPLILAPPLVEPPSREPAAMQQQFAVPTSLLATTPAPESRQHETSPVAEPPVQITIGRIEVTAVSAPPAPKRVAPARKASMPLHDYLARRRGGLS